MTKLAIVVPFILLVFLATNIDSRSFEKHSSFKRSVSARKIFLSYASAVKIVNKFWNIIGVQDVVGRLTKDTMIDKTRHSAPEKDQVHQLLQESLDEVVDVIMKTGHRITKSITAGDRQGQAWVTLERSVEALLNATTYNTSKCVRDVIIGVWDGIKLIMEDVRFLFSDVLNTMEFTNECAEPYINEIANGMNPIIDDLGEKSESIVDDFLNRLPIKTLGLILPIVFQQAREDFFNIPKDEKFIADIVQDYASRINQKDLNSIGDIKFRSDVPFEELNSGEKLIVGIFEKSVLTLINVKLQSTEESIFSCVKQKMDLMWKKRDWKEDRIQRLAAIGRTSYTALLTGGTIVDPVGATIGCVLFKDIRLLLDEMKININNTVFEKVLY